MGVYVDDMNVRADVPDGHKIVRGTWSHLFADTEEELRAFAAKIGLKESWIQHPGEAHVHFDVAGRMRQRAIAAGAKPVTWRRAGGFFAERASRGARRGRALRQAAHLYLGHGLLPVPAWAAKPNGECCCRRGAGCPRPGKHPRSVHAGPGMHDYSWKPLACGTHEEIDQRFADDGAYAGANLMLAIPAGMLVIDQDDDDGGPQAVATLAARLGELPATLAHRTPHGVHRIYRTPPGWTGRAWVGKDTRNPLPPGIDLRVPGQILMAPPSQVPVPGGLATYGPAAGTAITGLPATYLAAWTPPQPQPASPRAAPVPPDRAGTAAAYVHAKLEGITADLAAHEPGGRNTAIYTAALKAGSTLGAARATPGAGHAAAGWTGQAAEEALMEAAGANGYVSQHGAAMARSAIRSGLRNGLRRPRPLPDFTARPTPAAATREHPRTTPGAAAPGRDTRQPAPAPNPGEGQSSSARARRASRREAPAARSVSAVLRTAGYVASSQARAAAYAPEGYQIQPAPDGGILIRHVAIDEPIDGVAAPARIEQMLTRYAHTLRAAGFHVSSQTGGSLTVTPQPAGPQVPQGPAPAGHAQDNQAQASRAAIAANQAYRAGEFDRARQLTDQAAELDPGRADLWDRHRGEIAAKRLFAQARAAGAEGDHNRADKFLEQARELDPRMQGLWNRHLTGIRASRPTRQAPRPSAEYAAGNARPAQQPTRERGTGQEGGPQWPSGPARGPQPEIAGSGQTPHERHPAGPGDQPEPATPPGKGTRPGHHRARHSWEPTGEGTKRCTREGCGLEATRRLHPTERRWLTSYTKEGRTIVSGRVPACGEDLPQGLDAGQMRHLATTADRHAGHALRSGDIDRAYRLLTDARALDPARQQLWDDHEQRIRAHVAARRPRQPSQNNETAPCPQCGTSYARPAGQTGPCLSCESQTRLKAAGFTPSSPEIQRVAEWNHAAIRRAGMPQPQPGTGAEQKADPEITADRGPVPGEAKDLNCEREACG